MTFRRLIPTEKADRLTVVIRLYDVEHDRWIFEFKRERPRYDGASRLAGSVVLDRYHAVLLAQALQGIDPSHDLRIDGWYELLKERET